MKNWRGIPTTRLTLGGEVMVPRDNRTLVFGNELLNCIIPFATQGKIGTITSDGLPRDSLFTMLTKICCEILKCQPRSQVTVY